MIDERYIGLMHAKLDGEIIGSKDSVEIEQFLSSSAEGKKYFQELSQLFDQIGKMPMLEPPTTFKEDVMSSLPAPEHHRHAVADHSPLRSFFRAATWGYAVAFCAGILAGVAMYSLAVPKHAAGETANLSGTMSSRTVDEFGVGGHGPIKIANGSGSYTVRYGQGRVAVEVTMKSSKPLNIRIEYDPQSIAYHAMTDIQASENIMTPGTNFVQLRHTGEDTYLVIFDVKTATANALQLSVASDTDVLFTNTLPAVNPNS